MDPSTQAAQDVQNQTQQTTTTAQPAKPAQVPPHPKTQISVPGGGVEAGSAVIIQEDPDADDDEEELKVAPQETKNRTAMGQGSEEEENDEQQLVSSQPSVVDMQEVSEIQPAIPEVAISSLEVEKIVEITPPEEPKISKELEDIGITHSGLGIIDVSDIKFKPKPLPVTYAQVLTEEEKIKENRLHNSKFWLLEKIKYLWRKVNPDIEITVKKAAVQQTVTAQQNPVPANPMSPVNDTKQI